MNFIYTAGASMGDGFSYFDIWGIGGKVGKRGLVCLFGFVEDLCGDTMLTSVNVGFSELFWR